MRLFPKNVFFSGMLIGALLLPSVAGAATFLHGQAITYNDNTTFHPAVEKMDNTRAIVAYVEGETCKAAIASIDGTALTMGTEYQFNASSCNNIEIVRLDSTRAVIIYATSGTGYALVATIAGSAISFASPTQFATHVISGYMNDVVALDSTHIVTIYGTETEEYDPIFDESTSIYGTHIIAASVSGTSITFGSSTELIEDGAQYAALSAMGSEHIVAYYYNSSGTPYLAAASVTGTSMTFGSAINYADSQSDPSIALIDSTHAVVTYRSMADDRVNGRVITRSGTSLSVGSAQAVTAARAYYPAVVTLDTTHMALSYLDPDDDLQTYVAELTVASNIITGGTATVAFEHWGGQNRTMAALDSASVILLGDDQAIISTTDTAAPNPPSSFTATANGSYAALSWVNPAASDFFSTTIRRSTLAYPTGIGSGTSVTSGHTGASTTDTGLPDGTYYYGIFARDLRGNRSGPAYATVTIAPATTTTQSTGGSRGGSTRSIQQALSLRSHNAAGTPVIASPSAAPKESMPTVLRKRTCDRVMKWFKGNTTILDRVNARLMKRFHFSCDQ